MIEAQCCTDARRASLYEICRRARDAIQQGLEEAGNMSEAGNRNVPEFQTGDSGETDLAVCRQSC